MFTVLCIVDEWYVYRNGALFYPFAFRTQEAAVRYLGWTYPTEPNLLQL